MLVSDIISRVRRQAGDVDGALVPESTIWAWIDDAQGKIAAETDTLQAVATANVVAATSAYSVPTGVLTLHSVRYNGRKLRAISLQEFDDTIGGDAVETGEPTVFYVWAGQYNLYPIPVASITSGLKVYYTKAPVVITSNAQTPEIPEQYHGTIVDYCLAQYADIDDNGQKYATKLAEVQGDIQKFKDMPQWEHDQYPFIGASTEDSGMEGYYYE